MGTGHSTQLHHASPSVHQLGRKDNPTGKMVDNSDVRGGGEHKPKVTEKLKSDFSTKFDAHPHGDALKRMIIAGFVGMVNSIVLFCFACVHFTFGIFHPIWLILYLFFTVEASARTHEIWLGLCGSIFYALAAVYDVAMFIYALAILDDLRVCTYGRKVTMLVLYPTELLIHLFMMLYKGHTVHIYRNGGAGGQRGSV